MSKKQERRRRRDLQREQFRRDRLARRDLTERPSCDPVAAPDCTDDHDLDHAVFYLSELEITREPIQVGPPHPPEVERQGQELFELLEDDPDAAIPRLEALVAKFPNVPMLYNWLSAAYTNAGRHSDCEALIEENYRRNPAYLFAKTGYANLCINRGESHRVPEIFENKLDLLALYPGRKRFHITEYVAFMHTLTAYLHAIGRDDIARRHFKILSEMVPGHPLVEDLRRKLNPTAFGRVAGALSRMIFGSSRGAGQPQEPEDASTPA